LSLGRCMWLTAHGLPYLVSLQLHVWSQQSTEGVPPKLFWTGHWAPPGIGVLGESRW
jgi:hypothetical protein